jgi:iron complex outermembrane recepter protein
MNGLSLVSSYSYLDNVVTDSNTTVSTSANNLGKTPLGVPRNIASLWADYKLPRRVVPGLNIGAGSRFTGQSFGNTLNTLTVPGYTVFDAAMHYDLKAFSSDQAHWRFSVAGSNLGDRRYISYCNGGATVQATTCTFGLSRVVNGSVALRW